MSKENYGVHITHCCYIHGCKYGDKNCPVASGEVAQKYLCYDCEEEYEPYTLEEIELLRKTKSYRPSYKQLKEKIAELEAKLEEGEKEIKVIDEDRQFKAEMWTRFADKCKDLKEQLAEKDEIIDWQNEIVEGVKQEEELLAQKLKSLGVDCIEDLGKTYNQDKISFAVEQLEKVKEWMNQSNDEGYIFRFSAMDIREMFNQTIDNQIKQLKETK